MVIYIGSLYFIVPLEMAIEMAILPLAIFPSPNRLVGRHIRPHPMADLDVLIPQRDSRSITN
jgi:hypothetical protein